MNDMGGGNGGGGAGGFDGERPLTVTSVLKEFQGLKDKFKNEDEDDCELFISRHARPWCCCCASWCCCLFSIGFVVLCCCCSLRATRILLLLREVCRHEGGCGLPSRYATITAAAAVSAVGWMSGSICSATILLLLWFFATGMY